MIQIAFETDTHLADVCHFSVLRGWPSSEWGMWGPGVEYVPDGYGGRLGIIWSYKIVQGFLEQVVVS